MLAYVNQPGVIVLPALFLIACVRSKWTFIDALSFLSAAYQDRRM